MITINLFFSRKTYFSVQFVTSTEYVLQYIYVYLLRKHVDVENFSCVEPPPDIAPTVNVSVLPGDSAVLTCIVYSTVPYNVTWYGPGGVIGQNQQFTNFNNGSLLIR